MKMQAPDWSPGVDGGMESSPVEKAQEPTKSGSYHVVLANSLSTINAERLFDAKVDVIAVQDLKLASKFATTIVFGNTFHKTSVLTGLASMISAGILSKESPVQISVPLAATSVACAGFYNVFVATDPISQYQIDRTGDSIASLPSDALESGTNYAFLVHKTNTPRIILHTSISSIAAFICYRQAPDMWHSVGSTAVDTCRNLLNNMF
eukprot:m.15234 g.15234  ORF g.15234 m.15234 type:complete len:208 (-) comp10491_c0_seq1:128-751(-)